IAVGFKQIKDPPPPLRDINPQLPVAVERVILKALEKDPIRRHHSVTELKSDLEAAILQPAQALSTEKSPAPQKERVKT
ncbi:MAG TPA: serine/threonine-protein kinase, partial [Acidobacteriota bacterium]|nr:serine/threonine-protein kinase [Acidobacteriota bacterium]